jgi:hypothetical protein
MIETSRKKFGIGSQIEWLSLRGEAFDRLDIGRRIIED